MKAFKKFLVTLGVLVLLVIAAFAVTTNYSWLFSKDIEGQIFKVERVALPAAVVVGQNPTAQQSVMFSFAVAIRTKDGHIYTASSEDRQWGATLETHGMCARARFYPYPPWDLDAAGTYMNARLLELKDCPSDWPKMPIAPNGTSEATAPSEPAVAPAAAPAPQPTHQ